MAKMDPDFRKALEESDPEAYQEAVRQSKSKAKADKPEKELEDSISIIPRALRRLVFFGFLAIIGIFVYGYISYQLSLGAGLPGGFTPTADNMPAFLKDWLQSDNMRFLKEAIAGLMGGSKGAFEKGDISIG